MQYESAPFLRRLAARLLDLIFSLGLTFVVAVPVFFVCVIPGLMVVDDAHEDAFVYGPFAALSYFIAYVGLEVFLLIRRDGQTLGKGLLGLRVVPAGEWARPQIPLGSALIRMLIIFLPFVFLSLSGGSPDNRVFSVLAILGILSLLASLVFAAIPRSGQKRALHDFAGSTRVVRAARRKIVLGTDLRMALPGKLDMAKHN